MVALLTQDPRMSERSPSHTLIALIPALLAVAIGWGGLHGAFVRDDLDYVSGNPHVVCGVSPWVAWNSPFQPLKSLGLWRPLATVSLALDAKIAHSTGDPSTTWPFHLTNLLLAGIAAGATALLALRLGVSSVGSVIAGAAVALHPARTEAVLWISGRAECLMTAAVLATLLLAFRPSNLRRDLTLAVLTFLACSSKEQAFVLPMLVALLPFDSSRERIRAMAPVVLATSVTFTWRTLVVGGPGLADGMSVLPGVGFVERIPYGLAFLGDYLLSAFGSTLISEYDEPRSAPSGSSFLSQVGILSLFLAIAVLVAGKARGYWKKGLSASDDTAPNRAAEFGVWLFIVPLLPVLNVLMRTGEHFAERFLALPLCGFAIHYCGLLFRETRSQPTSVIRRYAIPFAATILLIACGSAFQSRINDWASPDAVVAALMRDTPNSASATFLASAQALEPAESGRNRNPAAGREYLRLTLERHPQHIGARTALALLDAQEAERTGDQLKLRQTRLFLEETLAMAPACDQIRGALGLVAKAQGDNKTAIAMLEAELTRMPAHLAWALPLAELLDGQGDRLGAASVRQRVERAMRNQWRIEPGFAPVAASYVWALAEPLGQPLEALDVLNASLKAAEVPNMRTQLEGLRTALRDRGSLPR